MDEARRILYRRENGSLFINSFAHGGSRYELKAAPEPGPDLGPDASPDPADAEIERLASSGRRIRAANEGRRRMPRLRASMLDKVVAAKRAELGLGGATRICPADRSRLTRSSLGTSRSTARSC